MLAMFCFSAAYNLSRGPKRWLLRRCDHAAIFIKIAATYTPFAAAKMGGTSALLLLAAVWGIALAGAAAKLIVPHRVASVSTLLYLAQGWMCIFSMQPLLAALSPTAMTLLIVGGVLYSVGVVFHLSERLPYHNAIWHGFVLVASACHFAAVTRRRGARLSGRLRQDLARSAPPRLGRLVEHHDHGDEDQSGHQRHDPLRARLLARQNLSDRL